MNPFQPHKENFMKTAHLPPICAVQSITYRPERRVITLASTVSSLIAPRLAVKRRKTRFRLIIQMAPEAASSFATTIQVRSQAKP